MTMIQFTQSETVLFLSETIYLCQTGGCSMVYQSQVCTFQLHQSGQMTPLGVQIGYRWATCFLDIDLTLNTLGFWASSILGTDYSCRKNPRRFSSFGR